MGIVGLFGNSSDQDGLYKRRCKVELVGRLKTFYRPRPCASIFNHAAFAMSPCRSGWSQTCVRFGCFYFVFPFPHACDISVVSVTCSIPPFFVFRNVFNFSRHRNLRNQDNDPGIQESLNLRNLRNQHNLCNFPSVCLSVMWRDMCRDMREDMRRSS